MAYLTVLTFDTGAGAGHACDVLVQLEQQGVVTLDAVVQVAWPRERSRPQICPLLMEARGCEQMLWGRLCAQCLNAPVPLAREVGRPTVSVGDEGFADGGRSIGLLSSALATITAGSSALVVESQEALGDQVVAVLHPLRPVIRDVMRHPSVYTTP
jgi:uncharacterized membrane protein